MVVHRMAGESEIRSDLLARATGDEFEEDIAGAGRKHGDFSRSGVEKPGLVEPGDFGEDDVGDAHHAWRKQRRGNPIGYRKSLGQRDSSAWRFPPPGNGAGSRNENSTRSHPCLFSLKNPP